MRSDKDTKKAASKGRARMLIRRDLAWLEGYPSKERTWISLPLGNTPAEIVLGPQVLSRSVRTINVLLREFPRVLPKLVGDPAAWAESRRALINTVKPVVHDGAPLPVSPISLHPKASAALKKKIRDFEQTHADLQSVTRAFQWLYWTDLAALKKSLVWLAHNARPARLVTQYSGSKSLLTIARLRQLTHIHGARRVAPLLEFLGNDEHWQHAVECPATHVADIWNLLQNSPEDPAERKKRKRQPLPAQLPVGLSDWATWLAAQDKRSQKRGLALFEVLMPQIPTKVWANWWQALSRSFAKADVPKPQKKGHGKEQRKKARQELEELFGQTPPSVPNQAVMLLLHELPLQGHRKLFDAVQRALPQWPPVRFGAALRLAVAHHWFGLWQSATTQERSQLRGLVELVTEFATRFDFEADRMRPWDEIWKQFQSSGRTTHSLDHDLVYDFKSGEGLRDFFGMLSSVDATSTRQTRLLAQHCCLLPAADVRAAFENIRDTSLVKAYVSDDAMRLAASIAGNRPELFARLLEAFRNGHDRYTTVAPAVALIRKTFEDAGLSDILVTEFERGDIEQMLDVAVRAAFVISRKHDLPKVEVLAVPPSPQWLRRYPEEFHEALIDLARFDPRAAKTADRLLRKDFPDPAELKAEIEVLAQLDEPKERQVRRMESLRRRLTAPASVSGARATRLRRKIDRTTSRTAYERWKDALQKKTREILADYLGVEGSLASLDEGRLVEALLSVVRLNPSVQELAKRLLRARAGPPPWDLREARPNQDFLQKMSQRGLCLTPWLDHQPQQAETKDGTSLTLRLEPDPLEIFLMGQHFDTCLSPGAFNYFSVFSNAADINKAVLFARDPAGRVYGRMLIGITDEGGLLPFHPYTHGRGPAFQEIAQRFVQELAEAMSTLVVSSGHVSRLVADDWYDDGPVDLTRRHTAFEDGSSFRKRLKKLAAADLLTTAQHAMAPLPLNELTLPMLLSLPEIEERPDLLLQLLPLAQKTQLPLPSITRLSRLVMTHVKDTEKRSLARWLYDAALQSEHGFWIGGADAAELLITLDPVRSLRLVRQTRPSYVRRWKDEDGFRLVLGAQANEQLHRLNKAYALYEMALSKHLDHQRTALCKKAMKRLRPPSSD